MNLHTSEVILNLLGGSKFTAMTGAKNLATRGFDLQFTLPKRAKDKINMIKVEYVRATDSFKMCFYNYTPSKFSFDKVKEVEGLLAADLRNAFEANTGLVTSL
jgi:hypothetical protein